MCCMEYGDWRVIIPSIDNMIKSGAFPGSYPNIFSEATTLLSYLTPSVKIMIDDGV